MRKTIPFPLRFTAVLAAIAAAGLSGCLSDSGSDPSQDPPASTNQNTLEGIHGTRIYAKDLGGEHRVEFYDFGGGNLGIRELGSMDEASKPLLPGVQLQSLGEAYLKLNPEASSVPEAIRSADQAAKANPWQPDATDENFTVVPTSSLAPLAKASAANCSQDFYHDGWGATWFKNSFCTEGRYRSCFGNSGEINSGWFNTSWAKWMQFEGDFNTPGRIRAFVQRWEWFPWPTYGIPTYYMDHEILPRHWEAWTTGGRDKWQYIGSSPCGHVDVNLMWN